MKRKLKISLLLAVMMVISSCYETHVINQVHEDGSVTRTVIMKSEEEEFDPELYKVPVDSTWNIDFTIETNKEKDTTWVLTAVKHFRNVEEINAGYENHKGENSDVQRRAGFSRRFNWFTTVFRYTETVNRILDVSCPLEDFFSEEELRFIYLPDHVQEDLLAGPDSLKNRIMADSIEVRLEKWIFKCDVRQFINIFYDLLGDDPGLQITREEMMLKESQFVEYILKDTTDGDPRDSMFIAILGEDFYRAFRTEMDSALSVVDKMDAPFWDFGNYNMEIRMPGRIIASNGYVVTGPEPQNGNGIFWTVKGEYFLTQDFEMWTESRVNNYVMWVITAIFILFVITGLVIFQKRKRVA